MILFGLLATLPYFLPSIKFFSELLNKLSFQSELPKQTIQLLISLIPVLILTLIFSLKCIFKKEKTIVIGVKKPININPLPIIKNESLPKQSIDILKLLRNGNKLHPFEIKEKLSLTDDELSHYIRASIHYISKEYLPKFSIPKYYHNTDHSFKWKLNNNGIDYLIENNL